VKQERHLTDLVRRGSRFADSSRVRRADHKRVSTGEVRSAGQAGLMDKSLVQSIQAGDIWDATVPDRVYPICQYSRNSRSARR
jgi:hypothetical protein